MDIGRDHHETRAADYFVGRIAVHPFGARVPGCDRTIQRGRVVASCDASTIAARRRQILRSLGDTLFELDCLDSE